MKCATIVAQDHPHRVKADWILRGLGALAPGLRARAVLGDFADLASLKEMFRIGQADGMNGWMEATSARRHLSLKTRGLV
jgi:hypothetical protein